MRRFGSCFAVVRPIVAFLFAAEELYSRSTMAHSNPIIVTFESV